MVEGIGGKEFKVRGKGYKVILLGRALSGKTAVFNRMTSDTFELDTPATAGKIKIIS